MNDTGFANTAPTREQAAALIATIRTDAEDRPACRLWSIVDPALLGADRVQAFLRRWPDQTLPALGQTPLAAFGEHGPCLLSCGAPGEWEPRIASLLQLAGDAPAVSWVLTDADITGLRQIALYLARVWVQSRRQPVHCRFADTRVLPGLLACLEPGQLAPLQDLAAWYWCDREGQPIAWRRGPRSSPSSVADEARLVLSITQFRAIQSEAEPDILFNLLLDKAPELVPADSLGAFHARLKRLLARATQFHVNEEADRLQYLVLALSCGEDFHRSPALSGSWPQVASGDVPLSRAMQQWGDDVWQALEAGRAHELA